MSDDGSAAVGEPAQPEIRTYVTGEAYGAMPARTPPSPARASLPWFLAGVVMVVATSAMGWHFFHADGGYAAWWWGGYLAGALLWRTAWSRWSAARAATGDRLSGGAIVLVLIGLAAAVGSVAVLAATSFAWRAPPQQFGVGSCWSDSDGRVDAVPCGDRGAEYVAVAEAPTAASCPATTRTTVSGGHDDRVLCLVPR